MAKANSANSPIPSAVASLAAAAVGTPVDTTLVTATDAAVDTTLVTATGVPISAPVVPVKVRVLAHCGYGKPDDVIQIDPALVESLKDVVDATPAAVAYAESLSD